MRVRRQHPMPCRGLGHRSVARLLGRLSSCRRPVQAWCLQLPGAIAAIPRARVYHARHLPREVVMKQGKATCPEIVWESTR